MFIGGLCHGAPILVRAHRCLVEIAWLLVVVDSCGHLCHPRGVDQETPNKCKLLLSASSSFILMTDDAVRRTLLLLVVRDDGPGLVPASLQALQDHAALTQSLPHAQGTYIRTHYNSSLCRLSAHFLCGESGVEMRSQKRLRRCGAERRDSLNRTYPTGNLQPSENCTSVYTSLLLYPCRAYRYSPRGNSLCWCGCGARIFGVEVLDFPNLGVVILFTRTEPY